MTHNWQAIRKPNERPSRGAADVAAYYAEHNHSVDCMERILFVDGDCGWLLPT